MKQRNNTRNVNKESRIAYFLVVLSKILIYKLAKEVRFTGTLSKIHILVTLSKMLLCAIEKLLLLWQIAAFLW